MKRIMPYNSSDILNKLQCKYQIIQLLLISKCLNKLNRVNKIQQLIIYLKLFSKHKNHMDLIILVVRIYLDYFSNKKIG